MTPGMSKMQRVHQHQLHQQQLMQQRQLLRQQQQVRSENPSAMAHSDIESVVPSFSYWAGDFQPTRQDTSDISLKKPQHIFNQSPIDTGVPALLTNNKDITPEFSYGTRSYWPRLCYGCRRQGTPQFVFYLLYLIYNLSC